MSSRNSGDDRSSHRQGTSSQKGADGPESSNRSEVDSRREVISDLVENNPDLVLCVDPSGRILYANRTTLQILGFSDSLPREVTFFDLLAEESHRMFDDLSGRLAAGETVGPVEMTLIDADEKRVSVEGKINGRLEEGKPIWYRVVLRDLREAADEPPFVEETSVAEQPRILVVEDDRVSAHMLATMLERAGYATDRASTANEALSKLEGEHYDAMTLDLALPDRDGVDLLHQIRSNPETASLPVVIVSASADEARDRLTGDAAHVVDWLNKPFEPNSLKNALTRAVPDGEDRKPRVLHVEDDAEFGEHVRLTLADVADTQRAATLSEARRMLQESEDYDLVLLDLTLPDGLGAELLPFLNRPRGRSIPVILASSGEATDALAAHVSDTLVKSSATQQELLETIRAHLRPSG